MLTSDKMAVFQQRRVLVLDLAVAECRHERVRELPRYRIERQLPPQLPIEGGRPGAGEPAGHDVRKVAEVSRYVQRHPVRRHSLCSSTLSRSPKGLDPASMQEP